MIWKYLPFSLLILFGQFELRADSLQAGAATVDITPEQLPVSMTGGFQDRLATGAHDKLHARCVVLDDGKTRIAIVIVDSCLITHDIFDKAKNRAGVQTGIPANHILAASTHTHTAPTAVPLAQCHPDPDYIDQLTNGISDSIIAANRNLVTAKLAWNTREEPGEINNRRWFVDRAGKVINPFGGTEDRVRTNPPRGSNVLIKPADIVDPIVSTVSIRHADDDRPLALLSNYSLHYVGGLPTDQLSADYFGEFSRQISQRLDAGPGFVGLLSNGASGDVNNYNFREPRPTAKPFERIQAVAGVIANAAAASTRDAEHRGQQLLAMVEREIDLAIRKPDAEELKRARELVANAAEPARLNMEELYANEAIILHDDFPEKVTIKLQALRIGDLAIVAIPCEVFARIGVEIREQSPFEHTFTIGLANGYNGYLPTPEQHALGGYETWRSRWSYLETEASTAISAELAEMLDELAKP
ncbi:MAG: neutral ceramidase [Verrucomicrobiales bacterium]|jgi:neutral ceramidase